MDSEEVERILRSSGGTASMNFGEFEQPPFAKNNFWRDILGYVKSRDENHVLARHVRVERCKMNLEKIVDGIQDKELLLRNRNIFKSYLMQKLLTPQVVKDNKVTKNVDNAIYHELIYNEQYLADVQSRFLSHSETNSHIEPESAVTSLPTAKIENKRYFTRK